MSSELIAALQNPALYDHPVEYFEVIETHISWVLLTGRFAYKIKKPVNFEVLDFSSLNKRRHFCHCEVRANQGLSPEVYLAVLPITGSLTNPSFAGEGEVIEYAIMMREFSQENLLLEVLKRQELSSSIIDEIATTLASFHKQASRNIPNNYIGTKEQVYAPVKQNFEQILALLKPEDDRQIITQLSNWAEKEWLHLQDIFTKRRQEGCVRECHGDVHLGNIVLIDKKPIIFDCIEFNEEFRWTDVMADVAFLAMDLIDCQQPELANQFVSYYLEHTGDYDGLHVLAYYLSYRAVVRAKINLFRLQQTADQRERDEIYNHYSRYMRLALQFTQQANPIMFLTYGLAGSGKSTVAQLLVRECGVIRLRSDVIRKQLHEIDNYANSKSGLNQDIYSPNASQQTYDQLLALAQHIINAGYSVVVDAAFLKYQQRKKFIDFAKANNIRWVILACAAPMQTLRARIELRQAVHRDPSEADVNVLEMQNQQKELLLPDELEDVVVVDAQDEYRYKTLGAKINAHLARV